ncbi:uncharacterized protein FA14DRAFT_38128 [Meira miltonrushii]|uniref:F-box domain-containing protein n=1 Tax=Meira miltonrushii TaxID=1280837 RepID=A0A316VBZ0_9BASI|nr:uncharacterized protein FA14DRAFT_38128 [Meira miltonrushii]PWN35149.1 hypothetical protein FA14DRAFT_38128 [Meira miltonrushii]
MRAEQLLPCKINDVFPFSPSHPLQQHICALFEVFSISTIMMSLNGHKSLDKMLPDEVLLMIFSNLTVIELARAQQTCKRWYSIAREHSTLWKDATAFFSRLDNYSYNTSSEQSKRVKLNIRGFQKLQELSKWKLDGISLLPFGDNPDWNNSFREVIFKALQDYPPTRLSIKSLMLGYAEKHIIQCLELLAKNRSLKHLALDFVSRSTFWNLELTCSLESLELECPSLSGCRNKEGLIQAFKGLKRLRLISPFERPGNLEFLEKIGQNLESLRLEEISPYQATVQNLGPDVEQKTIICFPKLLNLTVWSRSHISNTSYQLNCPRLQSLTIIGDLSNSKNDGQEISVPEMLISTETTSHISVSLPRVEKQFFYKACLQRFFGKFRHVKELCLYLESHATLEDLVDTLPETVSMLAVNVLCYEQGNKVLFNRLSRIHRDGGTVKKSRKDDDLVCKLDAICVREQTNSVTYNDLTIFGRANLRALAFGRGK